MRALLSLLVLVLAISGCSRRTAEGEAARGLELARQGRLEEAVAAFDEALRRDPGNLKALYNRGLAWLLRGNGPAAVDSLSEFVRLRPDDAMGHFDLARGHALAGERLEALESLQRAVELGFSDHELLVTGGGFQMLYGDVRFVALEMVVAQRAGKMAPGGSLGQQAEAPAYGGTPVQLTLPGLQGPGTTCDPEG